MPTLTKNITLLFITFSLFGCLVALQQLTPIDPAVSAVSETKTNIYPIDIEDQTWQNADGGFTKYTRCQDEMDTDGIVRSHCNVPTTGQNQPLNNN